jgi:hypothetical protein
MGRRDEDIEWGREKLIDLDVDIPSPFYSPDLRDGHTGRLGISRDMKTTSKHREKGLVGAAHIYPFLCHSDCLLSAQPSTGDSSTASKTSK